jgi:hypothetical protein
MGSNGHGNGNDNLSRCIVYIGGRCVDLFAFFNYECVDV